MLTLADNIKTIYPKIETLFNRDPKTFKINVNEARKQEFKEISKFEVTEKINGTNVRIVYNDKKIYFLGRTEKATLPKELENWLQENITVEKIETVFKEKYVVLYGEGFGGKIQSGQGYSEIEKFILFDIRVGDFWLMRYELEEIAKSLDISIVDLLGYMNLDEITELVSAGFSSKIGNVPICEGIVAKSPLFLDRKKRRIIFKLKHSDFK